MPKLPEYHFDALKNRWSTRNNLLSGIGLPALLKLFWRHGRSINWFLYWHRVMFLISMAAIHSALGVIERALHSKNIAAQQLHPEPIFVLGHPRTGTTLLQNCLSYADCRYAYVDTFQAGFPSTFLILQRCKFLLSPLIDKTRPMDAMELSFSTPAEDEIAVNVLTGGISPYLCLTFMDRWRSILPYATFEGVAEHDVNEWVAAFLYFLKKVTFAAARQHGGTSPRPLIIKSPVHVGRLPLLRALFPGAKFVFVHRDPIEVFCSSAQMAQEYFTYCFLSRPSNEAMTDYILEQHKMLYDVYLREKTSLPAGSLAEVAFTDLERDPVGALRRVYGELQLPGFEAVEKRLEGYCTGLEGFKKNDHRQLSPGLKERVQRETAAMAAAFGYS